MNKKVGGLSLLVLALLGSGCKQRAELPNQHPEDRPAQSAEGQLSACKSNLKNLGTACEMYSVDWAGLYPAEPSALTPDYLKAIPQCPAAGSDTYSVSYQTNLAKVLKDKKEKGENSSLTCTYSFHCQGHHHESAGKGENKPAYDSVRGLVE